MRKEKKPVLNLTSIKIKIDYLHRNSFSMS